MEVILRNGIVYRPLVPRIVADNLSKFFFERMYLDMAFRCAALGSRLFFDSEFGAPSGRNAQTDMSELMMIVNTFSIVCADNIDISGDGMMVNSTLELVNVAHCLVDVLPADKFDDFLRFLDMTIKLFVESLSLPHNYFRDRWCFLYSRKARHRESLRK